MLIRYLYLFAVICFALFLICLPLDLAAQRQIGIRWQVPDDIERASRELDIFQELGITYLEVNRELPPPVWSKIHKLDLNIFGALPIRFPLPHTFSDPDSASLDMIRDLITHYSSQKNVQAISLFQYGPVQNERFTKALIPYVQQIKEIYSGGLYYLAERPDSAVTDSLFDFKMVSIEADDSIETPGENTQVIYYYNPSDEFEPYITPVKRFLEETSSVSAPVFFNSQWMLEVLNTYPGIQQTIKLYTSDPDPVFATPEENLPATSPHSLIILLLIFIWGGYAVNYSLSPVFRKSLFRYFMGHRFYVEDIMQRHIRSMAPAGVMLLLHAILAGIAAYCFISVTFSDLGIEALSFHLPVSILGGNFIASVVVVTCLVTLAIEGTCLLWLFLTNPHMRQLAQVVNLYAWPMQLNLFIVTCMVTLLMAGYYPLMISILGVLFLLVFLSAFVITSFDTARYVKNKHWYLAGTAVVYCGAWITLFIWVFSHTYLMDIYGLALSLS